MDKLLKDLKGNKYTIIALVAFVAIVVMGYFLYKFMVPNSGNPLYGNRLDGQEVVAITNADINTIKNKITEASKNVISVAVNISGRTINVTINVAKDTKIEDAKKLAPVIVSNLKAVQVSYHDIQVFITNENADVKGYPMIGYKEKSETVFTFSGAK